MKAITFILLIISSIYVQAGRWLPREIKEVRAYVYDYKQEPKNMSLLKDGRLHTGIINTGGSKLSDDQIKRLKKALVSSEPRQAGALCYMPHHGFIFFDSRGKAMGHIELCFQCGNVDYSPRGLPDREWNWKEMKLILEELKIPVLKKDEQYTLLFTQKSN